MFGSPPSPGGPSKNARVYVLRWNSHGHGTGPVLLTRLAALERRTVHVADMTVEPGFSPMVLQYRAGPHCAGRPASSGDESCRSHHHLAPADRFANPTTAPNQREWPDRARSRRQPASGCPGSRGIDSCCRADELLDALFELSWQVVVVQQDPVFHRAMISLDLALRHRVVRPAADMI